MGAEQDQPQRPFVLGHEQLQEINERNRDVLFEFLDMAQALPADARQAFYEQFLVAVVQPQLAAAAAFQNMLRERAAAEAAGRG